MNNAALNNLGYGLYIVTAKDDGKDSGCITNTVMQVSNDPILLGAITINKQNNTHDMIMKSKKFNVSILTVSAPFEIFQRFGFQTGKTANKFADFTDAKRSANGIFYITKNTNAYLSFEVLDTFDFNSHTMFKAEITDCDVLSKDESATYAYYHKRIKPQPAKTPGAKKAGYRCNLCGFVYAGETLPDDFICPVCKRGAKDFKKIK